MTSTIISRPDVAGPTRQAGRRTSNPAPTSSLRVGFILTAVLVTQLMIVLDAAIVNIALPDIAKDMSMTSTGLSWVVNSYTLAFGGLLLLGARAGDIIGRRLTFLIGMTIFVGSSLLGGFASDASLLLASRAAQGVGAALVAPSALTLLMSLYRPGPEQTRAIGWYTVVSASGAAIGLIAGGVLTSIASWRWVFFVNVPIGAAVIALAAAVLPRTMLQRGPVDVVGALLATIGMTSLVYGFIRAASDGWTDAGTAIAFVLGTLLMIGFVKQERRVAVPLVPLRLFADRDRVSAYVARLLLVAGSMGTFFFMSQYMQLVLHWTPWQSGLAFLPIPVSVFTASNLVSRVLARRYSTRTIAVGGLLLSGLGLFLMSRFDAHTSYPAMIPALVAFGLGNGSAFVPLTAGGLAKVKPQDTGVASGLVNVTQQLGGAVGLAVLVTVFASAGQVTPGAAGLQTFVTGAERGTEVASAMLFGAALLVGLLMRRPYDDDALPQIDSPRVKVAEAVAVEA
ncbi:MFS transporter [Calidifontibacter terrae]